MLTYALPLAILAWIFRKPLARVLAKQLPDRTTRHRVIGTVIAAFVIVIVIRLLVRGFS
jgi:hypothetical protein